MPKQSSVFSSAALRRFLSLEGSFPRTGLSHSRSTHKPCEKGKEQVPYQRAGHAHPGQAWQAWLPLAARNATISLFGNRQNCSLRTTPELLNRHQRVSRKESTLSELRASFSDDTASQQRRCAVGSSQTHTGSSGKYLLYADQRFAFEQHSEKDEG